MKTPCNTRGYHSLNYHWRRDPGGARVLHWVCDDCQYDGGEVETTDPDVRQHVPAWGVGNERDSETLKPGPLVWTVILIVTLAVVGGLVLNLLGYK